MTVFPTNSCPWLVDTFKRCWIRFRCQFCILVCNWFSKVNVQLGLKVKIDLASISVEVFTLWTLDTRQYSKYN